MIVAASTTNFDLSIYEDVYKSMDQAIKLGVTDLDLTMIDEW